MRVIDPILLTKEPVLNPVLFKSFYYEKRTF